MSVYSGAVKVGGWHLRMKAIGLFILGVVLIIIGTMLGSVSAVNASVKDGVTGFFILLVLGLGSLLLGWFYWKRSRSLVQGRLYSKKE